MLGISIKITKGARGTGLPHEAAPPFPLPMRLLICSGGLSAVMGQGATSLLATCFASGLSFLSELDAIAGRQGMPVNLGPRGFSLAGTHYSLDALNSCSSGT